MRGDALIATQRPRSGLWPLLQETALRGDALVETERPFSGLWPLLQKYMKLL